MPVAEFSLDPVWCFSVFAAPEACVMPRVLELFAKRGLVPSRFHGAVIDHGAEGLVVDVHVDGLESDTADHVAACLRGIVHVDRVLMALKRPVARVGAYA